MLFKYPVTKMVSGIAMATSPQQFCLRWNNHQSNIISVFEQLLHTEAFVDVTLAVEGMSIKAHKVVLSACSPYFQAVLASHPDKHPIIILKDVRYVDMRDLLDFMYRGEVSVDQNNLSGFLRVAESLRIKGLTEVNEKKRLESTSSSPFLPTQSIHQGSPTHGVISTTSVITNNDIGSLKRPPLSPTGSFTSSKRRRGRPPKISGEESESDSSNTMSNAVVAERNEKNDSRLGEDCKTVKMEAEEFARDDLQEDKEENDGSTNDTSAGSSWDTQNKDDLRVPIEEPEQTRDSRESPGSDLPTYSLQPLLRTIPAKRPRGRPPRVPRQHQDSSKWLPLLPKPSQITLDIPSTQLGHTQVPNINGTCIQTNPTTSVTSPQLSPLFLTSAMPVLQNSMNPFDISPPIPCSSASTNIINPYSVDNLELSPARLPGGILPLSVELGIGNADNNESNDNLESDQRCQSIQDITDGVQMGIKVRGLDLLRYGRFENGVYICTECEKIQIEKTFKTSYSFQRHAYLYHEGSPKRFPCPICHKEFSRPDKRKSHLKEKHRQAQSKFPNIFSEL